MLKARQKEFTVISNSWPSRPSIFSAVYIEEHQLFFAIKGTGVGELYRVEPGNGFSDEKVCLEMFDFPQHGLLDLDQLAIVKVKGDNKIVLSGMWHENECAEFVRLWSLTCDNKGIKTTSEIASSKIELSERSSVLLATWENVLAVHVTGTQSLQFYRDLQYYSEVTMKDIAKKLSSFSIICSMIIVGDLFENKVCGYAWCSDTCIIGDMIWGPVNSIFGNHAVTKLGNVVLRNKPPNEIVLYSGAKGHKLITNIQIKTKLYQPVHDLVNILALPSITVLARCDGIYELK